MASLRVSVYSPNKPYGSYSYKSKRSSCLLLRKLLFQRFCSCAQSAAQDLKLLLPLLSSLQILRRLQTLSRLQIPLAVLLITSSILGFVQSMTRVIQSIRANKSFHFFPLKLIWDLCFLSSLFVCFYLFVGKSAPAGVIILKNMGAAWVSAMRRFTLSIYICRTACFLNSCANKLIAERIIAAVPIPREVSSLKRGFQACFSVGIMFAGKWCVCVM